MENIKKKCSLNKHSESDAISYCQQCKAYLCNKCHNLHPEVHDNHNLINLDKNLNEIFIDICKEEGHNNKLEFFCKNHNSLCCLGCVCKIRVKGYGQHSGCNICYIDDIKDEKKNKLKENIIHLEKLFNKFESTINELKILFEKIDKGKEELKLKIQKIFTKIRNSLNEKEDKLLLEVDEKFNEKFIKEDIIRESEKIPNKIKISLEKGKLINEEWNDNNLNSLINDCIDIENNIKKINEMNEIINKNNLNKNIKIDFSLNEEEINEYLNGIKSFGKIIIISDEEKINYELYNNFDIKIKKPIYKLNTHTNNILCLALLDDGRLASCSKDTSIKIYNKLSYKIDLIIKEHKSSVYCIIQLSSGILASCSRDKTIKLFNIKNNNYKLIQTLNYHTDAIYKIIELKNKSLVSCSEDSSIIFFVKDNLEYKKDYSISTDGSCSSILQTKDNEICYSVYYDNKICFYDFIKKRIINSISNISKHNELIFLSMICKELLVIPGYNKISIVNVNEYKLIKIIDVPDSSWIYGVCMLNKNMLLTGDESKVIRQWKIEVDNLILISKKENAHDEDINVLLNLGDGHIASASDDQTIRIC